MPSLRSSPGFTLLELLIVIFLISVIIAMAVPQLLEMRKGGNETSAITSLRTIATAQTLFRENDLDEDGVKDFAADMAALGAVPVVDSVLSGGLKAGYRFQMTGTQYSYTCVATPADPGNTGDRHFFLDDSNTIRVEYGNPADANSPPLDN